MPPGPIFDVDSKRSRLLDLQNKASAPDLWSDADAARKVLAEAARLEDDLTLYDRLASRLQDLETLNELAVEEGDEAASDEVSGGVEKLRRELADLDERILLRREH